MAVLIERERGTHALFLGVNLVLRVPLVMRAASLRRMRNIEDTRRCRVELFVKTHDDVDQWNCSVGRGGDGNGGASLADNNVEAHSNFRASGSYSMDFAPHDLE